MKVRHGEIVLRCSYDNRKYNRAGLVECELFGWGVSQKFRLALLGTVTLEKVLLALIDTYALSKLSTEEFQEMSFLEAEEARLLHLNLQKESQKFINFLGHRTLETLEHCTSNSTLLENQF